MNSVFGFQDPKKKRKFSVFGVLPSFWFNRAEANDPCFRGVGVYSDRCITSLKLHTKRLFKHFLRLPSQSKINVSIEAMKSLASLPSSSLHVLSTILFSSKITAVSSRTQLILTHLKPMLHSFGVGRPSPVIQDGARGKAKLVENNFEEARSKGSCGMALFQRHNQGT